MRQLVALALMLSCLAPLAAANAFDWTISSEREQSAADGVSYHKYFLDTSRGGMHVHTVRIAASSSFALMPVIAGGKLNTVAPVSELAKSVDAVAAINGGFFDTGKTRLPVGLVKIKRRIIFEQFLNRAVLGIDEQGQLHFDTFRLHSYIHIPAIDSTTPIHGYNRKRKAGELVVYTPEFGPTTRTNEWGVEIILQRISPDHVSLPFIMLEADRYIITGVNHMDTTIPEDGVVLSIHRPVLEQLEWLNCVYLGMEIQLRTNVPAGWESFPYLLGGGPMLVKGRKIVLDAEKEQFGSYFAHQNARTAVGRTDSGDSVIIVVDKSGTSAGARWDELAELCLGLLGLSDAMGFDGGGSSTMYVGSDIVNSPAGGAQRNVANILAVVPFNSFTN